MASPSEDDSPLHSAVRQGQLEEVRKILDEPDVDVNCINSNHETPLHLACALDHSSVIEPLIAFGADVYIKDSDNRNCYGRMNSLEICNLVNRLLYNQNLWLEGPTFTDKDGQLHNAVKLGQLETVQDIMDQNRVDINDKNSAHETPLHIACAMGHSGIVHLLIINGTSMCERDSYNNAPIHRAAGMGHTDIVDMIVTEFGCDPTIRGYQGRSLLHFACGSGNVKLLEMLVQKEFLDPVNDRDACGLTPLHIAALCGHEKIINMFIDTFNCPVDCQDRG
jgi:ankyrin repeat protein